MTAAVEFGARDDAEGQLLAEAFHLLLAEGLPVTVERLAAAMGRDAETVTVVLGRLERAGRTRRNPAGAVTGSLGLSVEPTAHELIVAGARRWTWCAYDAVGILAALGAGGQVRSRDPHTGAAIQFGVQHGRPVADSQVVLFLAEGPCVSVVDDWCPLVNFFQDRETAAAWAAQHGVTGTAVPLQQAAATGDAAWRSQLDRRAGQQARGGAAACC